MDYNRLNETVGNIDIYLLDQILKGRFHNKVRILDAGCGEGRNLKYFHQNGFNVYGIDNNPIAIKMLHMMHKAIPMDHFLEGNLEQLPWKNGFFDSIICCAVLHFAPGRDSFMKMMAELSRILKPKGILFIRMASNIGLPQSKDKSFNYLLTREDIDEVQSKLAFTNLEPVKSVIVEDKRSMAVWVLEKN